MRSFLFGLAVMAWVIPAAAQTEQQSSRREEQRDTFLLQQQEPDSSLAPAVATPCAGGFAGVYPCHNIDLLTFMPLNSIGGGNGNDLWGWTDPLDNREYAVMGRSTGTSFIDVTDPENPIYLGNLPPHGGSSPWRDIKVYSNHAYIVSEAFGHGMQVFDLTQLRSVVSPPVTFSETAHYDDFGSAHNVAINEDTGFAYAVGTGTCSGGPHFIDLAVPAAPVFAGCHIESIYTHDTQCVIYAGPDPDHQGREVCINSNEDKINIIDVTDHSNPTVISSTIYNGARYTHQGWLTEDQAYWLQGDELDEQNFLHNTRTLIFDVTDLDSPVKIANYDGPTSAIDHNLYTHEGYAYEANYQAGLRILDLTNVSTGNLTEVAYFDIYPSSNSALFNGAWSVYPYFESGNVLVSGIEQGMFILRPLLAPEFDLAVETTNLAVCDPGTALATVTLTDRNNYAGSVNLSAVGLPAGSGESWSVNPVTVPGSSELSVSTTGVAPGVYPFTVSGTDGALVKEQSASLDVASSVPGQPALTLPTDGAVGVSRTPVLVWESATQGSTYQIEIATDPGFANVVFNAVLTGTITGVNPSLDQDTAYYWRVTAANACGNGVPSATFGFTTLETPRILLVDDDDNGPDVQATYTATLNALGEDFDLWDTNNTDDEPTANALEPYEVVVWFTGDEFGGVAGPGPGGESALEAWLDSSRCLLISSQDYYYDRGLTNLIQNRLGVSAATSDVGQTTADGQGAVFGGLGPYALSFTQAGYTNYTDELTPGTGAEIAFNGSQGVIAVSKDTGLYRTSFWSFGLEALPSPVDQETTMSAFLSWCAALAGLDGDTDGSSNGADCAPADPSLWAVPSPARQLTVEPSGLQWQAPTNPGGSLVQYDLVRSESPAGFLNATCVETAESDTVAAYGVDPVAGGMYCYLVRASNGCGTSLGDDSQPAPRVAGTCP